MTVENLKKANELVPIIEKIKKNIDKWENAISFRDQAELPCTFKKGVNSYSFVYLDSDLEAAFEILKALSLKSLNEKLNKFTKELEAL